MSNSDILMFFDFLKMELDVNIDSQIFMEQNEEKLFNIFVKLFLNKKNVIHYSSQFIIKYKQLFENRTPIFTDLFKKNNIIEGNKFIMFYSISE